ncbi:hypothetical protein AeRB84_005833 [Aphanomyces euteiches]|nr:hypothetical protein AeRB84_005833 [Aphanomyces euteiches]
MNNEDTNVREGRVKLDVPKYSGAAAEILLVWEAGVKMAIEALDLQSGTKQVAFAISCLSGKAHTWVVSAYMRDPAAMNTMANFITLMKATYLPKDAQLRHLHQLMKATQGKLSISEFAQKMEYHWLSLPDKSLISEAAIANSFMHGLHQGPSRLELFRRVPKTMTEALAIALGEHYSQAAASHAGHVDTYDMEISQIGTTNPRCENRQFDQRRPNPTQGRTVRSQCAPCARDASTSTGKLLDPVGAGLPTGRTDQHDPNTASSGSVDLAPGTLCRLGEHHQMLSYLLPVPGFSDPLRVLIDSGASENYARRATIARASDVPTSKARPNDTLRIRLADGRIVSDPRQTVVLDISIDDFSSKEEFFLMDLDDRWDLILGMEWLERHQHLIDWHLKTMVPPHPRSHVSNPAQSNELAVVSIDPPSTRTCDGTVDHPRDEQAIQACDTPSNEPEGLPAIAEEISDVHEEESIDEYYFRECAASRNKQDNPDKLSVDEFIRSACDLEELPTRADEIVALPEMSFRSFSRLLRAQERLSIAVICVEEDGTLHTTSTMDKDVLDDADKQARTTWESLKTSPYYDILMEYKDVFPDEVPAALPSDKGIHHEIDLVPGTKYCVTRQWPLPRDQVDFIDSFFAARKKAGHVRESNSPHSSPTFCVKKPNGGWRIVHAFNTLNQATIPAQTPIPRKDVIIDSMADPDADPGHPQDCCLHSQWAATFNRMVTAKLRPLRAFAPLYFDDIYIHSRGSSTISDVEIHRDHLLQVLSVLRKNGLYANLGKCMFGVQEIPVLGEFVGVNGCRADPAKVQTIRSWPVSSSQTELRSWLGLATYLHKFSANFASLAQPLSVLLGKDAPWVWTDECNEAFNAVKQSMMAAPVLALPDFSRPFSVVCDASVKAIGCCLMQVGADGRDRPVSYQSRQLQKAEKAYPVHDLELLAMKYALTKFRIYLLGSKPFVVYTDHASLRTAVQSPHISQRMARWLSFFAECAFAPSFNDTTLNHVSHVHSNLLDRVHASYASDTWLSEILSLLTGSASSPKRSLTNFSVHNGLVYYTLSHDKRRLAIPADEALRRDILHECHAVQTAGHFGRDKTYLTVSRHFWWPRLFKSVSRFIAHCDVCQRVKASPATRAPLAPLPIPDEVFSSVSMDYIFGLPRDKLGRTGIWTCVDRLSKYLIAVPCRDTITAEASARIYFDNVFCRFGLPASIVSDRDPRFTSKFWTALFALCGTSLDMSTSDHPETDGQSERANRVIEDVLRSYAQSKPRTWSTMLPHVAFAYNNSVQASTGHTPFFVVHLRHPHIPLSVDSTRLSGEGSIPTRTIASVKHFVESRKSLIHHVRENLASAQTKQALQANKTSRRNTNVYSVGDLVPLHASAAPKVARRNPKLQPPWFGPFPITKKISNTAYKLDLPADWQVHPTFYVGKIKSSSTVASSVFMRAHARPAETWFPPTPSPSPCSHHETESAAAASDNPSDGHAIVHSPSIGHGPEIPDRESATPLGQEKISSPQPRPPEESEVIADHEMESEQQLVPSRRHSRGLRKSVRRNGP